MARLSTIMRQYDSEIAASERRLRKKLPRQKYQSTPNNERLKTIIDDIIKSGKIQKDDLTIVVVDGK